MAPVAISRSWRWFSLFFGGLLPALGCTTLLWYAWTAPAVHDDFEFVQPLITAVKFMCSIPTLVLALSGPACGFVLLRGAPSEGRACFLAGWLTLSSFIAFCAAFLPGAALLSMVNQPGPIAAWLWSFTVICIVSAALCAWIHFRTAERLRAVSRAQAKGAASI